VREYGGKYKLASAEDSREAWEAFIQQSKIKHPTIQTTFFLFSAV
jgi:hypothetical protein